MSLSFSQRHAAFSQLAGVVVANRFCYLAAKPNLLFSLLKIDDTFDSMLKLVANKSQELSSSSAQQSLPEILPVATQLVEALPGSIENYAFYQLLQSLSKPFDSEVLLANAWGQLRAAFVPKELTLGPWHRSAHRFEREIILEKSSPFYASAAEEHFDFGLEWLLVEESTMTPKIRLISSYEKNKTPGTCWWFSGATGRHSLDENAIDAADWCDYILSNLYNYNDVELTGDHCRAYLSDLGITCESVTYDELRTLREVVNRTLSHSIIGDGSLAVDLLAENLPITKSYIAKLHSIKLNGGKWKGREVYSFNSDGFIGIAGWASSKNAQPLYQALKEWGSQVHSNRELLINTEEAL